MTGRNFLFVTLALSLLLNGCTLRQYSYINHLPHDPAFEKGGEVLAAASYGWFASDVEASASISPVKYIGLTAGIFRDLDTARGYNYGALVYIPVLKSKRISIFTSFHYEQAYGEISRYTKASFKSVNLRPSVYGSFTLDGLHYKTGITAQFTTAYYKRLFATETKVSINSIGLPVGSTTVLADAQNVYFTGHSLYWFIDISDGKTGFSGSLCLGTMPDNYNFRQIGPQPVQDKSYIFKPSFFFAVSLRYRLKLY